MHLTGLIATLATGLVALAACSSPSMTASSINTPGPQTQRTAADVDAARTACLGRVNDRYLATTAYIERDIEKGTRNGKFNPKHRADFLDQIGARYNCRVVALNDYRGLTPAYYTDLYKLLIAEDARQDRELANGRLSFVQYRREQNALWGKFRTDLADAGARAQEASHQRAAEQAAEEARQAEADAEEQDRTIANNAALMGAMMTMLGSGFQPAYRPAPSTYSAPVTASQASVPRQAPSPLPSNGCGGDIADLRTGRCEAARPNSVRP